MLILLRRGPAVGAAATLSFALLTALGSVPAAGQEAPPSSPTSSEARNLPVLESILDQELHRRLGPAERWQILVTATDEQRAAGQAPKAEIRGTNLHLPNGLVVAFAQLLLEGVEVDLQKSVLRRSAGATLILRVRPEDVERLIETKSKGKLRGVRIDCGADGIKTRGSLRLGFLSVGLSHLSHAEVRGNAVYVHTDSMKVMGLNATRRLRKMEARINPVVDLDEVAQPLHLDRLDAENGAMVLQVSLDLAAPLRPAAEVER